MRDTNADVHGSVQKTLYAVEGSQREKNGVCSCTTVREEMQK